MHHHSLVGVFRSRALTSAILLLASLAAFEWMAGASTPTLDGKVFIGELGEKGKPSGDVDEYSFRAGMFHSLACDAYGFGPAPYHATKGDGIEFESQTVSPTEGHMEWKGRVKGKSLVGTVVWTKEGQAPIQYWFRGQLKPRSH